MAGNVDFLAIDAAARAKQPQAQLPSATAAQPPAGAQAQPDSNPFLNADAEAASRASHSTLGDLGRSALGALARGTGEVMQGINDVGVRVNKAVPLLGAVQHFAEQHLGAATPAEAFAKDQALQDWGAREQANVSPQFAAKTAMGITDKGGFNPTNIANKSINTVAGMAPALVGTAIASLGGPETGIPAGMALFGAQGEAGGRNAGVEQVAALTDDQLAQVPAVKAYLAQGMTLDQARQALSAHAGNVGALTGGGFGAALGLAGEIPGVEQVGKLASRQIVRGIGKTIGPAQALGSRTAARVIGKGVGEGAGFAGINTAGQAISNVSNPIPTPITQGLGEAAASGLLPGFVMGAGRAAVSRLVARGPLTRAGRAAQDAGIAPPTGPDGEAISPGTPQASQGPFRSAIPAEVMASAADRLEELDSLANGSPAQTIVGPDGEPRTIPAVPPQFLTDEQRAERSWLQQNGQNPTELAKAFGVALIPDPKSPEASDLVTPTAFQQFDENVAAAPPEHRRNMAIDRLRFLSQVADVDSQPPVVRVDARAEATGIARRMLAGEFDLDATQAAQDAVKAASSWPAPDWTDANGRPRAPTRDEIAAQLHVFNDIGSSLSDNGFARLFGATPRDVASARKLVETDVANGVGTTAAFARARGEEPPATAADEGKPAAVPAEPTRGAGAEPDLLGQMDSEQAKLDAMHARIKRLQDEARASLDRNKPTTETTEVPTPPEATAGTEPARPGEADHAPAAAAEPGEGRAAPEPKAPSGEPSKPAAPGAEAGKLPSQETPKSGNEPESTPKSSEKQPMEPNVAEHAAKLGDMTADEEKLIGTTIGRIHNGHQTVEALDAARAKVKATHDESNDPEQRAALERRIALIDEAKRRMAERPPGYSASIEHAIGVHLDALTSGAKSVADLDADRARQQRFLALAENGGNQTERNHFHARLVAIDEAKRRFEGAPKAPALGFNWKKGAGEGSAAQLDVSNLDGVGSAHVLGHDGKYHASGLFADGSSFPSSPARNTIAAAKQDVERIIAQRAARDAAQKEPTATPEIGQSLPAGSTKAGNYVIRGHGYKGVVVVGDKNKIKQALTFGGLRKVGKPVKDGLRYDASDLGKIRAALEKGSSEQEKAAAKEAAHADNRKAAADMQLRPGDSVSFKDGAGRTHAGVIQPDQADTGRDLGAFYVRYTNDAGRTVSTLIQATKLTKAEPPPAAEPKSGAGGSGRTRKQQIADARAAENEAYSAIANDAAFVGKDKAAIAAELKKRLADFKDVTPARVTKLAAALHKGLAKRGKEIEKNANRDPQAHATALVDAIGNGFSDGGDSPTPRQAVAFTAGWSHALKGKTKSTMTGDDLANQLKGYAAAREWIKTPEGREWFEGAPRKKLANTGADLRRAWEQHKAELDKQTSNGKKLYLKLQSLTARSDLFPTDPPDGARPGVATMLEAVRDSLATFNKWIERWSENAPFRESAGEYEFAPSVSAGGKRPGAAIVRFLDSVLSSDDGVRRFTAIVDPTLPETEIVHGGKLLRTIKGRRVITVDEARQIILDVAKDYGDAVTKLRDAVAESKTGSEFLAAINKFKAENPDLVKKLPFRTGYFRLRDFLNTDEGSQLWRLAQIDNEAVAKGTKATPLVAPRLDRVTRTGLPDVRNGRNVTPEEFRQRFGFADVGFGKWVGSQKDQDHLNYAYDAFADLAAHLGIPENMIGFNGQMHFTIGALGHGRAAAHFNAGHPSPDGGTVPVINVTNTHGDGTVFHEWTHAFDLVGAQGDWPEVRGIMINALKMEPLSVALVEATARRFLLGKSWWLRLGVGHDTAPDRIEQAMFAMTRSIARHGTQYFESAKKLGEKYWGNEKELLARASEAWGGDTLGGVDTYLVNPAWSGDGIATPAKGYRGTPYPAGEERQRFNALYDALKASISVVDGKLHVSAKKFKEAYKDPSGEGIRRLRDLRDKQNMQVFYEEMMAREQEAKDLAAAEAAEKAAAEKAEADELAQKAIAELAPPTDSETQGPLTEDDISGIFDQALAELAEQDANNEPPETTRAPTEAPPAGPAGTAPDTTKAPGPAPKGGDEVERSAAKIAAAAARSGVQGLDEAMKGLVKLFGAAPGRLNSFPSGFDREAYEAAKPHFAKALKSFQEAGLGLVDLFKFLIQQFSPGIRMYAEQFAKDAKLDSKLGQDRAPADKADPLQRTPTRVVADWVAENIANNATFGSRELFAKANEAFGGTQAEGRYTPKDAYDAMESGVNRYIASRPDLFSPQVKQDTAAVIVPLLRRITERLATQAKRTPEMDEFQQFSTPPDLAFLAAWVARVGGEDTMLEPSAGTGSLAVFAKNAGAHLVLNELSSRRAAILRDDFPSARVMTENAEQINNVLPDDVHPTVVVMNPPFSATAGRVPGERDTMNGARHIEQALLTLAPGGRLVAIVGRGMAMDRPAFKEWWAKIGAKYDVRAVVPINGDGYAKYGTSFDNAMLVIDKVPPVKGRLTVTTEAKDYNSLVGLLSEVRDERPVPNALPDDGSTQRDDAEQTRDEPDGEGGTPPGVPPGGGAAGGARGGSGGRSGVGGRSGRGGRGGRGGGRGGPVRKPGGGRGAADKRGNVEGGGSGHAGDAAGLDPERDQSGVNYDAADKQASDLTDSVYEPYRPQRLDIPGARPHPGSLVESAAMASVLPPRPTYVPNLPREVVEGFPLDKKHPEALNGGLSAAQLEPVIGAGQAHAQLLPDGTRRGYFIGDGTGVGKGRIISGVILDNLRQGRKKAVWITEKQGLFEASKRDLRGAGADERALFKHGKTKLVVRDASGNLTQGKIDAKDGILFTTYSTLRQSKPSRKPAFKGEKVPALSRVDQIVNWLGEDYDGVIVLDEVHNAGNTGLATGGRGAVGASLQGAAVLDLLKKMPNARALLVSATGATELANLGYAGRLGLWGKDTAFANAQKFMAEMGEAGLAGMEFVARDMKQLGVYVARSLSYDGVTYGKVTHELSPDQRAIYDRIADGWQVVLQNIERALQLTGARDEEGRVNDRARVSNAMNSFWSEQLRFFSHLLTSLQMPSVLRKVEQDLKDGYAPVLSLVNTGEAALSKALARPGADGEPIELDELDLSPKARLIEMVRNAFPTEQLVEETDPVSGKTIMVVAKDSDGNVIHNKEAVALRDKLLKDLEDIPVPDGALDQIIHHFGQDAVAEVTGRTKRIVYQRDERGQMVPVLEPRSMTMAMADMNAFQDGEKPILVLSDAGGTGFDAHADLGRANQKRRQHYLVQTGWRADKQMQAMGRTHRSNEASAPNYNLVTTDVPSQARFIATVARRLDQVGALTRGSRDAASGGLFDAADNIDDKYGPLAVFSFFRDAKAGNLPGISFDDLQKQMGLHNLVDSKTGQITPSTVPSTRQFLNRLLSLKLDMQARVFEAFQRAHHDIIELARAQGSYDEGMQTIKALSSRVVNDDVIYTHPPTGAETRLVTLELTKANQFHDFPNEDNFRKPIWLQNRSSGKVWLKAWRGTTTLKDGRVADRYLLLGTNGNTYTNSARFKEESFTRVSREFAQEHWAKENDARAPTVTSTMHMVTGLILPIWDRLKTGSKLEVGRTQTTDGERLVGRIVPAGDVDTIRKRFDITSPAARLTPPEALVHVLKGEVGELANGWKLQRARVADELRVELKTGYLTRAEAEQLAEMGVVTERISWADRRFIPIGAKGAEVAARLFAQKPLVEMSDPNAVRADEESGSFSRPEPGTGSSAGLPRQRIQAIVDHASERWGRGGPHVYVRESPRQFPAAARALHGFSMANHAFYDGKDIWLARTNLRTAQDVRAALAHEPVHYALDRIMDAHGGGWKAFAEAVGRVRRSPGTGSKEFRAAINETERRYPGSSDGTFARELPAIMAERGVRNGLLARVVHAIRAFIRRIMPGTNPTEREALSLLRESRRYLRAPKPREPAVADHEAEPALSKPGEPFFSALSESVNNAKGAPKRASAPEWKQWLDGAQRRGEFKNAEREWLGVDQWLDQHKGTITRAELNDFVRQNQVRVQEVVHGDEPPINAADIRENEDGTFDLVDEGGALATAPERPTKFGEYTLPGGKNYRELLLTLPSRETDEREPFKSGHFAEPNILAHVRFNDRTGPNGEKILHVEEVQSDWHQAGRQHGYSDPKRPFEVFNTKTGEVVGRHADAGAAMTDAKQRGVGFDWNLPANAVPDAPLKKEWPMLAMKRVLRYAADHGYDKVTWTTGEQQAARYDLSKRIGSIHAARLADGDYAISAYGKRNAEIPGMRNRRVKEKDLPNVVGKEMADKIVRGEGGRIDPRTKARVYSGLDLKLGGEGMKAFYDKMLPNEMNKYVKQWGAKVGETMIDTDDGNMLRKRYTYEGPARDAAEVRAAAEEMRDGPADIRRQLSAVARAMNEGVEFEDAMEHNASETAARALGGKMVPRDGLPETVHSIDITPAMRESVAQGQPLFSRPEDKPKADPSTEPAKAIDDLERSMKDDSALLKRGADWLSGKLEDMRPAALGAFQTAHVLTMLQTFKGLERPASAFRHSMRMLDGDREQLMTGAADAAKFPQDMLRKGGVNIAQELRQFTYGKGAKALLGRQRPEAKSLFDVMHKSTIMRMDPTKDYERLKMDDGNGHTVQWTPELRRVRAKQLRQLLADKNRATEIDREAVKAELAYVSSLTTDEHAREVAYPKLKAQFDALPEDGKRLYQEVRDWYSQYSDAVEDALIAYIKTMDISDKAKGDMVARMRLRFELQRREGVYFPLNRDGDYWVSFHDKDGNEGFKMFETFRDFKRGVRQLRANQMRITARGRRDYSAKANKAPPGTFVSEMIDLLKDAHVSEKVQDQVYQAFLRTMPELSMRKHAIHRRNVAGFSEDALRAYSKNAYHGAHQLSRLRHIHAMQAHVDQMAARVDEMRQSNSVLFPGPGRPDKDIVRADALVGEMRKRFDWIMNPTDQSLGNIVNSIGFIWYLGASPASAITNLTQVAQTVIPVLGARHGWNTATKHVWRAWRDAVRSGGNMDKLLTNAEEKEAFLQMQKRGDFSRTQGHTLAGLAEGNVLQTSPAWSKTMNAVSWMFHTAELVNREAAGMAAYRIARAEGKTFEQALEYASEVNSDANFDYTASNRPRYMQGNVQRIALQFKNYSVGLTWLFFRNLHQAFKGATPEERRVAKRTVAGIVAMTALLAGATGLPIYNTVRTAANAANALFGDDNEPWNFDDAFHRWLADNVGQDAAQLIASGPVNYFTGANLSNRTSMANLWIRNDSQRLEGADAYHALLENLAGPFGGIVSNFYVGAEDVRRGNVNRGVERILPTAVKNTVKAYRYAHEGVNSMRGDPIVPDVSGYEDFLQAIGFEPSRVAAQYRNNNAMKNYSVVVANRRADLMNAYAIAVRHADPDDQSAALQKIAAFNSAHPEFPISASVLRNSLRTRAEISKRAQHGILVNPRLQAAAERFAGQQPD